MSDPSLSPWRPPKQLVRAVDRFLEEHRQSGLPAWVSKLDGPFNRDGGLEATMREFLGDTGVAVLQLWASRYFQHGLGTMAVPWAYFEDLRPKIKFAVLVGRPGEVLRLGRLHPSKDAELSMMESKHVVNVADLKEWQWQRRHLVDAFMPKGSLTEAVPILVSMADAMVANWKKELGMKKEEQEEAHGKLQQDDEQQTLDIREWMHHTALGMFAACMMGEDRAFGPALAKHTRL